MNVKKVENFTKKSFRNYTGPKQEFKDKNIIFGYNGRGKSSLVDGIIKTFLSDANVNAENYRLFDCNYIRDSLLLKDNQDSRIKGVVANFGKKDVDIENEIDNLENKIVSTDELEKEISDLNNKIRAEIDKIHDSKKGNSNINKKDKSKTNEKVISEYKEDLKKARRIEKDENKLAEIKGDNSLELRREMIESIEIPGVDEFPLEKTSQISDIFKKEFENANIPSSKVIDWVNEGLTLHTDNEKCHFCGNRIDLNTIKEKIENYNTNEKQLAIAALNDFLNNIKTIKLELEELLRVRKNFTLLFGNETEKHFDKLTLLVSSIDEYIVIFNKKIDNITSTTAFGIDKFTKVINDATDECKIITDIKRRQLSSITEKILQLDILVKGSIGLEIERSTLITDGMKKVTEMQKKLEENIKNNKMISKQISKLKKQKSNSYDFANHMNEILTMLEINLKLDIYGDDYIIKHSITDETLSINDISEGEKNLLSLLYFYYELFEDKQQIRLKSSIKLIVVDDPISSVDDNNKMYILELIEKIRDLSNVQVFIFTHVWEDFCNLCYKRLDNDNTPFRFYEIKKDSRGSKIVIADTRETPYKHDFKEIFEFSQKKDSSSMTECELYHYPNVMRKVLEKFLSFKSINHSPTRSNVGNIKTILCDGRPTTRDDMAIGKLLNVCNILSHNYSRNPEEVLESAKYLMERIKEVDNFHFQAMTN